MKKYLLFLLIGLISFFSIFPLFSSAGSKYFDSSALTAGSGKTVSLEAPVEQSILAISKEQTIIELSEFVYYNQQDKEWASHLYGDGTIGVNGCGPAALAMVISSLTETPITPIEMADWSYENGFKAKDAGSYHSLIPNGAEAFGLAVENNVRDQSLLIDALVKGKVIVVAMGPGHFTSSGHFITIIGIDSVDSRKVRIVDSDSRERTELSWDINLIMKEAQNDKTSDGGPFWIISKKEQPTG